MKNLLKTLKSDYLLVNSTNEYLVEYSDLSENARYTLTNFSGSTGDALVSGDNIWLFVDGRYHVQADLETKDGITIVKLGLGQRQDEEIAKLIQPNKTFSIVAKKVSQKRLENFHILLKDKNISINLLENDPINNFVLTHNTKPERVSYKLKTYLPEKPTLITNLEEVSYLTGFRDFSKNYSSKVWGKLFIEKDKKPILFMDKTLYYNFLKNYDSEICVDKKSINAYDYSLLKKPIHKNSEIQYLKAVKTEDEIKSYQSAFQRTDKAVFAIRNYIENNDNLSEYDIAQQLEQEFINYGAKSLSFKSIVAINQNSALAHYSKNSKNEILKDGDLVLIDCGAYYEDGFATDITRVFVKGKPNNLQKEVYTTVLRAFLNCYNSKCTAGYDIDSLAHTILDYQIENFTFSHGLGHGIGINVHEAPPVLNQSEQAHDEIADNMTFTIEPGLYNPAHFGIRLENSCYKKDGKIHSFVKMGFEGKLIEMELLTEQEKMWLKEFEIL